MKGVKFNYLKDYRFLSTLLDEPTPCIVAPFENEFAALK